MLAFISRAARPVASAALPRAALSTAAPHKQQVAAQPSNVNKSTGAAPVPDPWVDALLRDRLEAQTIDDFGELWREVLSSGEPGYLSEKYSRHFHWITDTSTGARPYISPAAYVAPSSTLFGDVAVHCGASVFYGAVLRADQSSIHVGGYSSIGDGAVLTTASEVATGLHPGVWVGNYATIGSGAQLQACRIGGEAYVGMNAIIGQGSIVEPQALVAANAVVPPGRIIKSGEIWGGNTVRKLRDMDKNELLLLPILAEAISGVGRLHAAQYLPYAMEAIAERDQLRTEERRELEAKAAAFRRSEEAAAADLRARIAAHREELADAAARLGDEGHIGDLPPQLKK